MKVYSRADLRKHLRSGSLEPVYTLFGDEDYLTNLAADTIADKVLDKDSARDFNLTEFNLENVELADALAAADQLPMLSDRRVVRIDGVSVSGNKSKDTLREDDEALLSRYLDSPSPSAVVVFVATTLDRRRKISKLLLNNSYAVSFERLSDGELQRWAIDRIARSGATAEPEAVSLIVSKVGDDLRRLDAEIDKLTTASLPDKVISSQLVSELTSNTRELSNFELSDHLISKNRTGALRVLNKVLDDGAEPVMLLGLLSYNFHRLFLAKEMMDEGIDRDEVAKVVRLPYGRAKEFMETARRADRASLRQTIKRLAEVDLAIKTSVATPRLQIEMLVSELVTI